MNKYCLILTLLVLGCGQTLLAQTQEEGTISGGTFIIEKKKKLEMTQKERSFELADELPPEPETKSLSYNPVDYQLTFPRFESKIKVPSIKPDPSTSAETNMIRAGLGNYLTTYAEGWFYRPMSKKGYTSLHVLHRAAQNGPIKGSTTSDNGFEWLVGTSTKNMGVRAGIDFKHSTYRFYGFRNEDSVSLDTLRQRFMHVGGNLSLFTLNPETKLRQQHDFRVRYFAPLSGASEWLATDHFESAYILNDERSFHLNGTLLFSGLNSDSAQSSRQLVQLSPAYGVKLNGLNFRAGVTLAYAGDSLVNNQGMHMYPLIQAKYTLKENVWAVFLNLTGQMGSETRFDLAMQNPWLGDAASPAFSNTRYQLNAGISGNHLERLDVRLEGGLAGISNKYFWVNNPADSSSFLAVYDTTTISRTYGNFMLSYYVFPKFRVGLTGMLQSFRTGAVAKAWHEPTFVLGLNTRYNLHDKIVSYLDFYYIGGRTALSSDLLTEVKLKNVIDLNLKLEYNFSSKAAAFLHAYNLLNQRYQHYYGYEVRGVQVMVGGTYKF